MKSVSRSLAAGKTSMPPTAKSSSGNTSVVVNPALTAAFSLSLPGTDAACAAKESTRLPCAAGSSRRSAKVNTPTRTGQQDRALEEQRGAVDGDGAHRGDVAPWWCRIRRPRAPTTAAKAAARATTDTNSWT